MNLVSTVARTLLPGLPAVRLSPEQSRQRNVSSPRLGATQTRVNGPRSGASPVMGQPSMRVLKRDGGGVVTELGRRSQWADYLTDADLEPLERVMAQVLTQARGLSRGPLSLGMLAAMGHPYGRSTRPGGGRRGALGRLQGARRGVGNLSVANRQSGAMERGWAVAVERGKAGVTLRLSNEAPESEPLAFGTRRMKAHGGFVTAFVRSLPAINREWAAAARRAQARARQLERIANEGGME